MPTGQFIALEGQDGVGKTTLSQLVSHSSYQSVVDRGQVCAPRGRGLTFVSRRQASLTSEFSARIMQHIGDVLWRCGDATDLSDGFWLTAQASWFTAHYETVLRPLLEAGHNVIIDGWIFKFRAKLGLQGYSSEHLDVVFSRVPNPDRVILLKGDVAAAFDRQKEFRKGELGMHAGYAELGRATFIDYQGKTVQRLERMAEEYGWAVLTVPSEEVPKESALRLEQVIQEVCPLISLDQAVSA